MSYVDLEARDDRERLMSLAFTLHNGTTEGQYSAECTVDYWRKQKARQEPIDRARNKVFK